MFKKMSLGVLAILFTLVVAYLGFQIVTTLFTKNALGNVSEEFSYGPKNADLVVVEFIKYTCPHCRTIHPIIMEAVEQDGNVRYVPRPRPSTNLRDAYMPYAAALQGDHFKIVHRALLQTGRLMEDQDLYDLGEQLGLDVEQLKMDMNKIEVKKHVDENNRLFKEIGASRSPTFIIGDDLFFVPSGKMPTVQEFLAMFNEARKS